VIERNGRPVAVVLSVAEYELFERLEDAHWGKRAEEVRLAETGENPL
jgi:prevent-host-death family protein